jgi:Uma2 family endonuclease
MLQGTAMDESMFARTWSAEEFLSLPNGKGYELIDGRLKEMHTGAQSSFFGLHLCGLLADHCERPFLGWVFPAMTSYQLLLHRPNLVRRPDVSFVRAGRFPNESLPEGHIRLAPDFAAEVVSPSEPYYDIEEKVREYHQAGVRLVWIVVPPTRSVLVRRLDGTISEVLEGGELSGEDVVPGFRCRVADIFHVPAPPQQPRA